MGWTVISWSEDDTYENPLIAPLENIAGTTLDENFIAPNGGLVPIPPVELKYLQSGPGLDSPTNVAIFQDNDPWGFSSIQTILTMYGIPYTIFSSWDIGTANLTPFDRVIVPSQQPYSFYQIMSANRPYFENYAQTGGVFEWHTAAYTVDTWQGLSMPFTIDGVHDPSDTAYITDPTHDFVTVPYVITPSEILGWNYTYHDDITSPTASLNIVIENDFNLYPVLFEFGYGGGHVIVTSMTLEWAYGFGYSNLLVDVLISEFGCDGCEIGGDCYLDGNANPTNECEVCDVAQSTTAWSFNDGASCDDALFCNGVDTCLSGSCSSHAGTPCPDDNLFCNGIEDCDETADICVQGSDPCPDDGLFCNGTEICDEDIDSCISTSIPCPDDSIFCNGVEECDEDTDTCSSTGDPCTDDMVFCNGVESCDEDADACASSGSPCPDDEIFCNGEESCVEANAECLSSGDPCDADESCNEDTDQCDPRGPEDDDSVSDDDDDDDSDDLWPEGQVSGGSDSECCGCS